MKVTGPGTGHPGIPADLGGTEGPIQATESAGQKPGITGTEGSPGSAQRLAGGTGTAQTNAASAAAPTPGVVATHDIAADLRAGTLQPAAAMDKLIERIVAQQLGDSAPAAVRDSLRAALHDAVETDPVLAAKLRSLGGAEGG